MTNKAEIAVACIDSCYDCPIAVMCKDTTLYDFPMVDYGEREEGEQS